MTQGACAPDSMGRAQIKVCFGRCVVPIAAGDTTTPCAVDECNTTGGLGICSTGYECVPAELGGSAGHCANAPGLFCDPNRVAGDPANRCPNPRVCVSLGTAAQVAQHTACRQRTNLLDLGAGGTARGLCIFGGLDGDVCDSTWDQAVASQGANQLQLPNGVISTTQDPLYCAPCAPGLECTQQRCRRPCGTGNGAGDVGRCPSVRSAEAGTSYQCAREDTRVPPDPQNPPDTFYCSTCVGLRRSCPISPASDPLAPQTVRASMRVPSTGDSLVATFGPGEGPSVLPGPPNGFPIPRPVMPDGQRVCCDSNAACVNGSCCLLPAPDSGPLGPNDTACTRNEDCCGLPSHASICCGAAGNGPVGAVACQVTHTQNGRCIGCGGSGMLACPAGAMCANDASCGQGQRCLNGACTPCGGPLQPCCPNVPLCGSAASYCGPQDATHHSSVPGWTGTICLPDLRCSHEGDECCGIGASSSCVEGFSCHWDHRCHRAPCGGSAGACCYSEGTPGVCNVDLACRASDHRCQTTGPRPCGNTDERCCGLGDPGYPQGSNPPCPARPSDLRCASDGYCRACGHIGGSQPQPCCINNLCYDANSVCDRSVSTRGTCVACGADGNPCCTGATPCSHAGSYCDAGICRPCGATNNACCTGTTPCSSPDDTCDTRPTVLLMMPPNVCMTCGTVGHDCCPNTLTTIGGSPACRDGSLCNSRGQCAPFG